MPCLLLTAVQVADRDNLEVTLHQMQEDLLLAQERLQQAGKETQQQVQDNQQLSLQMQQVWGGAVIWHRSRMMDILTCVVLVLYALTTGCSF